MGTNEKGLVPSFLPEKGELGGEGIEKGEEGTGAQRRTPKGGGEPAKTRVGTSPDSDSKTRRLGANFRDSDSARTQNF